MNCKKVRIAVAVAKDGSWNSCGWADKGHERGDNDLRASAVEGLPFDVPDGDYHIVWVEAEVPLPHVAVVTGEVVPCK